MLSTKGSKNRPGENTGDSSWMGISIQNTTSAGDQRCSCVLWPVLLCLLIAEHSRSRGGGLTLSAFTGEIIITYDKDAAFESRFEIRGRLDRERFTHLQKPALHTAAKARAAHHPSTADTAAQQSLIKESQGPGSGFRSQTCTKQCSTLSLT